ncbi:MAG: NAD(+) diphosphatase [Cohaesibacter sp.]|jgi:NAD+ diphosphatase|nr:NAD(+) diphosphatase [Cohaesibacter sp.]
MADLFAPQHRLPPMDGVGYVANTLMRDTEHRGPESLSDALSQPETQLYLLHHDKVLLTLTETGHGALYSLNDAKRLGADLDQLILLGKDPGADDAPRLAAPLKKEIALRLEEKAEGIRNDPELEGYELWSLRAVGIKGLVPPDQLGALAQGRSLLFWHANHQFCAKCGEKTEVTLGGARRDCPSCGAMHFPRTDPVVIMLAIHTDEAGIERCLLGHHTRFQGPMYSTLAGFMEQGETIEAAVRREIFEEAGIHIDAVRYAGSQPWPFPSSLMLGCYAEATSDQIELDETELSDAQWFTRGQVREMLTRTADDPLPHVPHSFSIASWLIKGWLAME